MLNLLEDNEDHGIDNKTIDLSKSNLIFCLSNKNHKMIITPPTSILRITNLSINLLMSIDVGEKNEVIAESVFNKIIKIFA